MDFLVPTLLAILQGITEFLPVSSSAHLILPSQIFGIEDQGLLFDTAVHGGTLLAVCSYYRKDFIGILQAWTLRVKDKSLIEERKLGVFLILASLPVLLIGFYFFDYIATELRSPQVIALTTIVFAPLLWWAWRVAKASDNSKDEIRLSALLICGLAQVLALVPGVSRSGITLTAALFLGYQPRAAARISFLLSIPVIGAAFVYGMLRLILAGDLDNLAAALWGAGLAAVFAYLTIDVFIRLLHKIGITPFVIYRLVLGFALLLWIL